jgi:glycine/D-amino acid oxidase-like deaminating enzyme
MVLPLSSGKVAPAWDVPRRSYPQLNRSVRADVAIIGGGIVGLAAAFELSKRGHSVALVEAGSIGEGSSGWCGGILSASTSVDFAEVVDAFGEDNARRILQAVTDALSSYSAAFGEKALWRTGSSIYLASKKRHIKHFAEEIEAHNDNGIPASQLDETELRSNWRGFHGGIRLPHEHAVNPVALMQAMTAVAVSQGAMLFEHSAVTSWTAKDGVVTVRTAGGIIEAKHVVIATGLSGLADAERKRINKFLIPVTGHVVVTKPSEEVAALARSGVIAAWDSLDFYHYVRYMADGRMLIGGEEKPGVVKPAVLDSTDLHAQKLLEWAREHHTFGVPEAESAWKATLIFPADGLPFVQQREVDGSRIVSAVTDGLPFAAALGGAIAGVIEDGSHWLTDCVSTDRHMPLMAKLAGLVPQVEPLRSLIHRVTFKMIEWLDRL